MIVDAHTNNLLPHPEGGWVLIDWDSVGLGPPAYDFMPIYLRPSASPTRTRYGTASVRPRKPTQWRTAT
ncbi:phosphotransferase family protein [Microbispora triticiradicis]|uniref:phosphotransferase family protein n=1 Tax=Microbispora triticiradicis TaxID=2200763 RepID=UPI003A598F63